LVAQVSHLLARYLIANAHLITTGTAYLIKMSVNHALAIAKPVTALNTVRPAFMLLLHVTSKIFVSVSKDIMTLV
jgi:hypothetical protein